MHIEAPDQSCFKYMSHKEFKEASPASLRSIFSKQNVVVRGEPGANIPEFTLEELDKLAPVDRMVTIHAYSLGDSIERHTTGTLRDVYKEHLKGDKGKVLNVLDLPMLGSVAPHPLSTDFAAFRMTEQLPAPVLDQYPIRDMRWGLAATKDASHRWHFDSDGFATWINVQSGAKLWVIATPPGPGCTPSEWFGDITQFLEGWSPDDPSLERWSMEAVVLQPGDTL